MSEFLQILTHGRRLQGAVKDLGSDELEEVVAKLNSIIENKKEREKEEKQVQAEKQEKIAQIQEQLKAAGLSLTDLNESDLISKISKSGKKRPVKYRLVDENGEPHFWTGIGRMPKIFSEALSNGIELDDFKI
ncbi:H-NS histone family protein [Paraneptunicella aestuarii]|uniref:H-NS family histone-like protein n=1 Tax=Paraneptunicella aestuarii TaxID=2831148 RepID=UPI001E4FAABC|nr:H-NS family nucleoid-associated regulatory protein [Paraneptunicella aestuarii]UAA40199.1 H-NS histone family protein [Paraneptunicella aestuarii]